jgi:hypothetical protein
VLASFNLYMYVRDASASLRQRKIPRPEFVSLRLPFCLWSSVGLSNNLHFVLHDSIMAFASCMFILQVAPREE